MNFSHLVSIVLLKKSIKENNQLPMLRNGFQSSLFCFFDYYCKLLLAFNANRSGELNIFNSLFLTGFMHVG